MSTASTTPVRLREVTLRNLREVLALSVKPEQTTFVASVKDSLADAEIELDGRPWYRAVYAGSTPVGFIMLSDGIPPGNPELLGPYYLWRLLVDRNHQRKGYGTQMLDLCVDYVRSRPAAHELLTSVVQKPGSPLPFYLRYGFERTDQVIDGELVLRLPI
jgi:diamine N-acetyltransferase